VYSRPNQKGDKYVSNQVVSGIVLGFGKIEAAVERYGDTSTHWLRISRPDNHSGFALHATVEQLETIYEALREWKNETTRNDLFNISQQPSNGASTRM
jgi:hypothetical protein